MVLVEAKPKPQAAAQKKREAIDLLIIGGGPAGLTAAIYALRAGLKTILVEKMVLGGIASTAYHIENFPGFPEGISGLELARRLSEQAGNLGLQVVWGSAAQIKKKNKHFETDVDGKSLQSKVIIIATGTESKKLDIPGEEKLRGRGVSYCATCDGPFYKDKNIIVVGGGNAAIEEALYLTRYAKKISIVHRRNDLRADKVLADRASANPKIYFFWHSAVEEIKGKEKVEGILLKDLQSEKSLTVPADGVFIYVGSRPNSAVVKGLIDMDDNGYIKTDQQLCTSAAGIFSAGDVRQKSLRQMVTAAADGAVAAESARKFIEESSRT
ncbi:MAG: thioredoxin-disulfide reductase [Candidatus Margulisbacteria bacterium]|nr:thioredoxin-disulfide reductase [Candidatus Margulisiibacteriota bacterium]